MKKTRFVVLSLIVCAMVTMATAAFDDGNISLLANSDAFEQTTLLSDFNSKTGYYLYGADVLAVNGATSTYVSCVIQRKENGTYTNVAGSWLSESNPDEYASVSGERYVTKGYWYRAQATYIVHINGQEYKIVKNSDQYWYN